MKKEKLLFCYSDHMRMEEGRAHVLSQILIFEIDSPPPLVS